MARIKQFVESGRFERQANNFFGWIDRPVKAFLWFAAGYFTFAVVRILQR